MADVGSAAAMGRSPRAATIDRLQELARKAPLAVEPFLINGALAEMDGRNDFAETLYLEARRRDPRSQAARYFLSSRYFATKRIPDGLEEIAVLARLVPDAELQFVPALASFAQSPGAVPALRRFFSSSQRTEDAVLAQLAAEARNADLILALASPKATAPEKPVPAWHNALLTNLVQAGQYEKAYAIWGRLGGGRPTRALFNPTFRPIAAPPPFNWAFETSKAGVVEPSENGLKIVYYGRDDAILLSQLLLLRVGSYQLIGQAEGAPRIDGLAWSLSCLPGKQAVTTLALVRPGVKKARFDIPASGCRAQLLELKGTSSEGAQPSELTIPRVDIARVGQ